jgi:RNA binding exosome subunit
MIDKLEITINVIIHSTEDILKIFKSFDEILEVKEEDFMNLETTGYFENPIIMLNAKLIKKQAQNFMKKILKVLSINQIKELIEEIEERTTDSKFHLRLDKQELVKGVLVLNEKGTVKIKIHTPIYNKKDTIKKFSEIFQSQLD